MTTVTIQNFRGIEASFELGQSLTLLCGGNGAGKSRVAQALGAVLTSEPNPLSGKRGDGKEVLGEGADKASVRIRAGDALRAILWPSGETSVKGDQSALPHASIWAAGLKHPLDLTGKERAQAFADIFRTEPTRTDLERAFAKRQLEVHLSRTLETIEISGWDAATKAAEDEARSLKRAWGEVTGDTWGERVGESWEPDAKRFADEDELQAQLEVAEENLGNATLHLALMKQARAELPEPKEGQKLYECAHCGKPNAMEFGRLVKADEAASPMGSKELHDARQAIASADGKVAHAQDQVFHRNRVIGAIQARLQDASDAKAKAKKRAAELHRQIMGQVEIANVCGPKGLRKAKLEHVLSKANESLAELAKSIGLPLVEIDADLAVAMDGTPFRRLSRAEQWTARTIMQLEIARRDGSTMVVVDDLDVPIDPDDRNRVLKALHASGLQAVVMLAARSPEPRYAPDLSAAGLGSTFWIDRTSGLRPIGEVQKQEQKAA